jgi:uncharacterized protein (DUF433 family)
MTGMAFERITIDPERMGGLPSRRTATSRAVDESR